MDTMFPGPEYGQVPRRTTSRRIEGPGRSEYIITHSHGSEYRKQSVFASAEPQSFQNIYNNHEPQRPSYYSDPPLGGQVQHGYDRMLHMPLDPLRPHQLQPDDHGQPPEFDDHDYYKQLRRRERFTPRALSGVHAESQSRKHKRRTINVLPPYRISSGDLFGMNQCSPRGPTFGISYSLLNPDDNSSVSLAQTSDRSLGHDGLKGSKKVMKGDCKVYKESIFNVSTSRYTNSLDRTVPVEAELVLQPRSRPTGNSPTPLMSWMYVL